MADSAITFQDENAKKFLADLTKNIKNIKELKDSGMINDFGAVVFKDVMDHFNDESGPSGSWPAWSTSYANFMKKIGRSGNKKLQFSGNLRQNVKPINVRKTSEGLMWFNNAKTKSGFPYAFAHNYGGPKLPQRQFMWLSNNAMGLIEKITVAYMLGEK